jgi:hypothetical protein
MRRGSQKPRIPWGERVVQASPTLAVACGCVLALINLSIVGLVVWALVKYIWS